MTYYRSLGLDEEIINEQFHVIDEVRDCIALFDKLNDSLTASWDLMFTIAKKYYEDNGDLDVPKRYITEQGFTLGSWLNTQRLVRTGKSMDILTDEQIAKLDSIGMRWESVRDLVWKRNFAAAKQYYQEHGDLLAPIGDVKYHGVLLGRWLAQLCSYRKNDLQSAYLTSERIEELDAIGMVWDVPDYLWEKKHNSTWEKSYLAAYEYKKKYGNLDIPVAYTTGNGCKLGRWLRRQRDKKAELSSVRKEKLDAIGMIWDTSDPWEEKIRLVEVYFEEHGDLNIPSDLVVDGVWLARWFTEQIARYNGKAKNGKTLTPKQERRLEALGIQKNVSAMILHGKNNMPKRSVFMRKMDICLFPNDMSV